MIRPKNAFIVLTSDCDRRDDCPYCFYNLEPERKKPSKLNTETIIGILKKFKLLNIPNVYLTGGEPLLRDDLEQIIAAARSMRLNTFLLSNGRSLDTSRAARLDRAGLDVFVLSLNSLELDDRKTVAVASRLRRAALSFIFVLTKNNIGLVPGAIELARAMGAGLLFQPAWVPEQHKLRSKLSLAAVSGFDWSKLYSELREWAAALGYEQYLKLVYDIYHERRLQPASCGMGTDAFVIDSNGAVYPCFHRGDLNCGDIRRDDFAGILDRMSSHAMETSTARCFGEHCVSLHTSYGR